MWVIKHKGTRIHSHGSGVMYAALHKALELSFKVAGKVHVAMSPVLQLSSLMISSYIHPLAPGLSERYFDRIMYN